MGRWGSPFSGSSEPRRGEAAMAKISLESPESEGADAEERRRANRARVTVRIDYATVDEMFSEFTRDINEGGLFIETEKPHQAGTEVSMQFHLPGSREVLQTVGRVVRVSNGAVGLPAGMGIEFDELTPDDRGKIDRIVRALRSGVVQ
ncbi:MAG: hypothetical protein CL908_11130 [Deltaproteobacteria bacterium]|nr:hypothetical protein [Deltaproteobacteria bacterium]